jgi:murein peptide amidase A
MLKMLQRSYQDEVVKPLCASHDGMSVGPVYMLGPEGPKPYKYFQAEYDVYSARSLPLAGKDDRPHVFISGGVHGDEPAGTFAALQFATTEAQKWHDKFRFTIIPCVNPGGFEACQRETLDGHDINRHCVKEPLIAETRLLLGWLKEKAKPGRFAMTFDLHEMGPTPDKPEMPAGYMLWEICDERRLRIGPEIIKAVGKIVPVCAWPKILGETSVGGVISYPEGSTSAEYSAGTSFDTFMVSSGLTSQAFTLESPGAHALGLRIKAHVAALNAALAVYLEKNGV